MTPYFRCTLRILRTPIYGAQWRRVCLRRYTTEAPAYPTWFRDLRDEMLNRQFNPLVERVTMTQEEKLENTLASFLPKEWKGTRVAGRPIPLGHHLLYFNPALPAQSLLPDGTDALHSPGDPFVRRMWAGGALKMDVDKYFHHEGWFPEQFYVCSEHIKDVQLRGKDDAAKIFITIERRFARRSALRPNMDRATFDGDAGLLDAAAIAEFRKHARKNEDWGDASLVEERNLVFMKERSVEEMEAIRRGNVAPIRHLQPPGQPGFSHSFTPTPSLLFRFSALTFNAHAIHLDPQYARNIEGHRNLLIHGPLSLVLMLTHVTNHLKHLPGPLQTIQSIEYRNLAPLYCNEVLRLCGREKKAFREGELGIYEVWIEGPSGGMAVKGTIRTAQIPK